MSVVDKVSVDRSVCVRKDSSHDKVHSDNTALEVYTSGLGLCARDDMSFGKKQGREKNET